MLNTINMAEIVKALKAIRLAVVFETKSEKSSTMTGPTARVPSLIGLNASLCILLYHISMRSAIGSSFNFWLWFLKCLGCDDALVDSTSALV